MSARDLGKAGRPAGSGRGQGQAAGAGTHGCASCARGASVGWALPRLRPRLPSLAGFPAGERRLEASRSPPEFVTSRAVEMVLRDKLGLETIRDVDGFPTLPLLARRKRDRSWSTSDRDVREDV